MAERKRRLHPHSVSATELSKLGHCELMVALNIQDDGNRDSAEAAHKGNQEHDRFHVRAVLNAGSEAEVERLHR